MSNESSRRSAAIPFHPRETIPVAPPLPTARPLQRARDVATRLFGYQSRSASPHGSPEEERHFSRLRSRYASLSATQNATASHKTGLEINTVAINEHGTYALLGGKEIFRTVKVEDGTFVHGYDLRGAIRSTPLNAAGVARNRYAIDIADVAWAKGDCGDFVAAATSSGKIILYDLGHAGLQAAQLHEHFRQVHKVTFNPHRGCLLLSGSQDGTVRLWDVRDVRQASTLQSRRKYSGQSDGVRDVKWSPTDGVDFAFGTDSGWIQRWDLRNLKTALVKIPAHSETCNAIDWHPDGKHIASASSDKTVRIWDFSTNRRPSKASWEIKAPHRIMNARWRPSSESKDSEARQCTQLVTTYDQEHAVVHVWDVRRPTLPFRELFPYTTAPTDLLWHSQDLLWLVGREGTFLQADIQHAPKVIEKRNLQAFATSVRGDVSLVTQKRPRKRVAPPQHPKPTVGSLSSSRSQSPQCDGLLSRSWVDDGLDEVFLHSKHSKPPQQPALSLTRAPSITTSSLHSDSFVAPAATLELGEVLSDQRALQPRQFAVYGPLPYCLDPKLFELVAQNYKADLNNVPDDEMFLSAFESVLEHNARVAYAAGLYRTAQTWRILSFTMASHLEKRAKLKAQRQMEDKQPAFAAMGRTSTLVGILHRLPGELSKSSLRSSPVSLKPVSALTQQLALSDRASDQQTPLAKPTISLNNAEKLAGDNLPDFDEEPPLVLPPSVSPPATHTPDVQKEANQTSGQLTSSNLNGLQSLQKSSVEADKRAMVRRWSMAPKEPLRLDPVDATGVVIPAPKLQRHNSDESFTFLDGSGGSRDRSFASSFRSNRSGPEDMVSERPSRSTVKENGEEKDKEFEFLGIETQDFDDRPAAENGARESPMPEATGEPFAMIGDFAGDDLAVAVGDNPSVERLADANGLDAHPVVNGRDSTRKIKLTPPSANGPASRIYTNDDSQSQSMDTKPAIYGPDDADIDFEATQAFTVVGMLREVVAYYASKHDSQTAAQMLLALVPLLPRTQPLPMPELTQVVSVYADAFTAAGFAPDEIEAIFATHMEHVVRAGMQPLQIEAVLSAYHDQLLSCQLYNEAAALRRLAYPLYPAVYEDAVKDNHVHVRCGSCRKPMTSSLSKLRCDNCGTKQASCAICQSANSPFPFSRDDDNTAANISPSPPPTPPQHRSASSLLTTCLRCNHSTHASCQRFWAAQGDGGCPTEGCLCDCVAGSWRAEKMRAVAAEKDKDREDAWGAEHRRRPRPRSHARVKSDEVRVRQSEAAELARRTLRAEGGKESAG